MKLTFTLAFDGIELDDFDVVDRLVEVLPDAHWGVVDGQVVADVFTDDVVLQSAVQHVVGAVRSVVPTARAIRIVEDFVAVPDIAKRTDMNRETVRLWSKETTFPMPRGVVGNGIKIWDWAVVNEWLRSEHKAGLDDGYRHASPFDVAAANAMIRQLNVHHDLLEVELQRMVRRPSAGWQQLSSVGFHGLATIHVSGGSHHRIALQDAVAG